MRKILSHNTENVIPKKVTIYIINCYEKKFRDAHQNILSGFAKRCFSAPKYNQTQLDIKPIYLKKGDTLPSMETLRHAQNPILIIGSGSKSNVEDISLKGQYHTHLSRYQTWLTEAKKQLPKNAKFLGICFSHQLANSVFDKTVKQNPSRSEPWGLGLRHVIVQKTDSRGYRTFSKLSLIASHTQQVTESFGETFKRPAGRSAYSQNDITHPRPNILTAQPHIEQHKVSQLVAGLGRVASFCKLPYSNLVKATAQLFLEIFQSLANSANETEALRTMRQPHFEKSNSRQDLEAQFIEFIKKEMPEETFARDLKSFISSCKLNDIEIGDSRWFSKRIGPWVTHNEAIFSD